MSPTIVLAGGGSGGHLSPGLAVAERLNSINPESRVVFACSNREIDRVMLEAAGARFQPVPAAPFSIRPAGLLRMLRENQRGIRASSQLLEEVGATSVLAMGGYVSIPVVRAARRRGVPVFLLNLDAVPGRANRLVARHADAVMTSVPLVSKTALGGPSLVGFPIRRAAQAAMDPLSCRERLGLDPALSTLLVTGASQGASSLDDLMRLMLANDPLALSGWQVIHLSGQADEDALRASYREAGVPAQVFPFLRQMGLAWGAADLALSRAGANSVAEAAANHVPTLFVPYPYHRDLHQRYNAEPLVASGAAELAMDAIDAQANRTAIGDPLIALLTDPARLNSMRTALEGRKLADGATEVATLLLEQG